MPHMMDDFPLLLSTLYDHAVRLHPGREIVSVEHGVGKFDKKDRFSDLLLDG